MQAEGGGVAVTFMQWVQWRQMKCKWRKKKSNEEGGGLLNFLRPRRRDLFGILAALFPRAAHTHCRLDFFFCPPLPEGVCDSTWCVLPVKSRTRTS